ncbi:MAG TPA: DUF1684 domain-containing protein [Gemmatimonadales bacterium]|nr:DUF1684 domain-containing protein [Gemmatimonadales bacterium]
MYGARFGCFVLALACAVAPALGAQSVSAERAAYVRWLTTAPTSPFGAVAQLPVGPGITLGPAGTDVPLAGVSRHSVSENDGQLVVRSAGSEWALPRLRPSPLGRYTLVASGEPGRTVLTVFSKPSHVTPPQYFPDDPTFALTVVLEPPPMPGTVLVLAVDGTEVDATEAGTVAVQRGGTTTWLTVRRLPGANPDESDLEIYFQDRTNSRGSYPAGRFVSLLPLSGGRYLLDFNRARNPFCAYNSVYACPAPWRGNGLPLTVRAGERYVSAAPPASHAASQ